MALWVSWKRLYTDCNAFDRLVSIVEVSVNSPLDGSGTYLVDTVSTVELWSRVASVVSAETTHRKAHFVLRVAVGLTVGLSLRLKSKIRQQSVVDNTVLKW